MDLMLNKIKALSVSGTCLIISKKSTVLSKLTLFFDSIF